MALGISGRKEAYDSLFASLELDLSKIAGDVTPESLAEAGLVRRNHGKIKLLANGKVSSAVTVRGVKMSAAARDKIVAAGGRVEE